ncbi:LysR family transcriptional regulator [Rhodoplanes sp. TEM]|uniref:LysR family transcriptional regulator n=1 Tax=Rhodoplanes tepidamans TaxID=200616 RepID=A0ABT5J6I2_RHOTP|nr:MULTISPECIES: LysR family transcriptional regulator [Rhodoplanes]MDC7785251.1 LysR family transcriptional regulator [Rhodoplanes tepidamans]MDC7984682.1 LysR family transcriptional regulator [Rhodoplanes sp. TEM]MDQ0353509.1 DNA-binding transcriptional LysR family regulator [Rhodoplanes tepidamans]
MDLDWLRDFLELAEHRNFSRAADARHVSQPAFSRRIRALEDWVGTPLFARGPSGVTVTPAGRHLRPLVEGVLRDLDRARRETRDFGEREMATLSIAATHALSFTFFPGWIRRHVRFDDLGTLNLLSDSMEACEQAMLGGEVHFLLCHHHADAPTRLEPDRVESARVGDDLLVPLSAPGGDGRPAWPLPGAAGRPSRLLAYSPASGLGRIVAGCPLTRDAAAHMETGFTSHLAATLLTMAREGHGVAWLPRTLAQDDIAQGRLVRAGAEAFDIAIEIRLFRSPDCRNRAADALWCGLADA